MDTVTLYVTQSTAIRKTADNCRRIVSLFDALRVKYNKQIIDTKEMLTMIAELSGTKELPQTFVGDQFLGNYEKVFELNEQQSLAVEFRRLGYAGEIVGGENIPVATAAPQTIKKRVVVKKPKAKKPGAAAGEDDDGDAPPPPPDDEEDEDAPPPPPDSDEDEGNAAGHDGDGGAPPPPPGDDEDPPPPPDDDDE